MTGIPVIVIPTIRSGEFFDSFLSSWQSEFKGCHVIIVEDRADKQLDIVAKKYLDSYTLYDWKDIDNDLGEDNWIIPRQTDCVRSYGYYKAWQMKPLFIVTLDDDVKPQADHIETFAKQLFFTKYPPHNFYNTIRRKDSLPRGTYYESEGCDVVHGGWLNVPDLSAEEHLRGKWLSTIEDFNIGLIPKNSYASICGMNLAWKPHVTKDIYFGLQGGEYPIDRCGDIWAGYNILQKGYSVYTGYPFCTHTKASNVWSNNVKEKNAAWMSKDLIAGYNTNTYWVKLRKATKIWEGLFNEGNSSS